MLTGLNRIKLDLGAREGRRLVRMVVDGGQPPVQTAGPSVRLEWGHGGGLQGLPLATRVCHTCRPEEATDELMEQAARPPMSAESLGPRGASCRGR